MSLLTPSQLLFIAEALCHPNDDKAAAKAANVPMVLVEEWRQDPAFCDAIGVVYHDHIEVARERSKALLVKAMSRLDQALDASKASRTGQEDDWVARLKAIELVLKASNLLTTDTKLGVAGDIKQVILDIGSND